MAAITADGRQELVALYLTMFGRAPSVVKLAEMVTAREAGATLEAVATALATDPAFALIASQDAESFATYLADALLAADIPASAREWAEGWVVTQVSGSKTKAQVIAEAVQAIRATENTNYASSQAELSADVTAALAGIDGAPQVTDTFTLTTGNDYADHTSSYKNGGLLPSTFTFTAGNEIVNAGAGSLNSTDALVDNSTTDADVLNATLSSGAVETPIIQNIETINLTGTIAGSGLSLAGVLGAKNINVTGNAAVALTAVPTIDGPVLGLNNYSRVATVTLADLSRIGVTDALSVVLNGTSAVGPNVATLSLDATAAGALEALSLESAGSAKNTLAITGTGNVQGVTKTTITGAADLDLRVAHGIINGQTVDGSAHTGALSLSINRNGAGTATTNLTNVSGVEAYTFTDSVAGADALVASGLANGSTVTLTYVPTGANSLAVKGAASSTTNSLTLVIDHATASTDIALAGGLTINDVETVNIVSEGGTTAGNSITGLVVAASSKVTVDGSTKLDLDLDAASTVSSVTVSGSGNHAVEFAAAAAYNLRHLTIDGSAATGKLTLDGTNFSGTAGSTVETLTILGGSGDDTITGTANADAKNVIDAGAGDDTVTVTTANNSTVTLGAGADKVTINTVAGTGTVTFTDFTLGTGGDVLSVNTAAAMTFGGTGAASANNQLVIITTAVADNAAAAALVSDVATAEAAIIVINNATGIAELWYDADGTAGGEVKLASFENITTVGALSNAFTGFTAANFGTWA